MTTSPAAIADQSRVRPFRGAGASGAAGGASAAATGADTLVFGSGWSPTGFSDSEFFRRCSGIGDILILNGSGRPKTLWLVIAPTVAAAGSSLEIIDEHGVLIGHAPVEHPRAEIKIDLKPAAQPRARYSLRFRRLTGAEAGHHWSHASFRLLRMSWESSQAALEAYARAFHDAVEDARPLLGPLPPAGQLEKGLRRWSSVETVMASQFALYQQLWSHLSLLEETQE